MERDYDADLKALRTACMAQDLSKVELTVSDLEKKWSDLPGDEYVVAIPRAADTIAATPFKDQQRSRDIVRRLAVQGITRAGTSHLDIQLHLLHTYSRLDPAVAMGQPSDWPAVRKESAETWCSVWRKLEEAIDPHWSENDPKNDVTPYQPRPGTFAPPGGAPPEAISDPTVRAEYKAHNARNTQISERNRIQITCRRLKRDFAPDFRRYLFSLYSTRPANNSELEECLAKIPDPELRDSIMADLRNLTR